MRYKYFVYYRPTRHAPWQPYALSSTRPITEYFDTGRTTIANWIRDDSIYRWVCAEIRGVYHGASCVARWAAQMPTLQEFKEWRRDEDVYYASRIA